jgi:hypothetical protein
MSLFLILLLFMVENTLKELGGKCEGEKETVV